jgi:hypothetical protein
MQPTNAPVPGPPNPDPLRMTEEIDALAKLAASAGFLDLLKEIGNAPEDQRLDVAGRLGTVAELKRRGLPITDANRLTMRYFEERPGQPGHGAITDAPQDAAPDEGELPGVLLADEELAAKDWTACVTSGYNQGGIIVCSSLGKLLFEAETLEA